MRNWALRRFNRAIRRYGCHDRRTLRAAKLFELIDTYAEGEEECQI